MTTGKLVVIEGLDGSGKATQTALLCEELERQGHSLRRLAFPDYDQPSSSLVKMYLNGDFGKDAQQVNPFAASSFYAVDRYASYTRFWKSDYEKGMLLVADRYSTSNAIYQMVKMEKQDWNNYLDWFQDYEYEKLLLPRPDLVIYLDMPVEISQGLLSHRYHGDDKKKDLHESNVDYLARCHEAALYAARQLGWRVIPCAEKNQSRGITEIHLDIMSVVKEMLY